MFALPRTCSGNLSAFAEQAGVETGSVIGLRATTWQAKGSTFERPPARRAEYAGSQVKQARDEVDRARGLLSYFRHHITNAAGEGFNSRIQAIKSAALGFRNFDHYRTRILFFCGKLKLLPNSTHGNP